MSLVTNHVSLLLWLFTLYTLGLYFFTRGFLLKRVVLNEKNQCNTSQNDFAPVLSSLGIPHSTRHQCWLPRRFSRAVFVIIDGLRYDFARWNESVVNPSPYENKLLTIHEVISRQPNNSKLYKFIADAPTTTLQRIKGLTTGGLPTFIEMGSNFDTPEIMEDNIIDQFVSAGKRIVFMGDDTWAGLFPGRFQSLYPFPSFNVKDLDTVDNGILEQLIPTMKSDKWDVIIAHFLGVDHCGHTYGPNHPLMGQKLNQLDLILKSVVSNLRDDTVLFVLGDHGMSSSGDHGGDSRDEVTSALFVYSRTTLHKTPQAEETILQIDLVPTVSLLLGIPIPFGNLGTVIVDLLSSDDENYPLSAAASYVNAVQVNRYLQNYVSVADDFSSSDWTIVQSAYSRINDALAYPDGVTREKELQQRCKEFLTLALSMCRKVWATFDLTIMLFGITLTVIAIAMSAYYSKLALPIKSAPTMCVFSSIINLSIVSFAFFYPQSEPNCLLAISLCFVLISCFIFIYLGKLQNPIDIRMPSADSALSWLLCLIVAFSVLSNSYIINEAASLSFFLQILILVAAVNPRPILAPTKRKWESLTNHQIFRLLLCLLVSVILRVCLYYQRCRPEQFWCVDYHLTHELASGRQIRFLASLASVCLLAVIFLAWLRHCGNLTPQSVSCSAVKYLTVFTCACICYFWSLSYLPVALRSNIPLWHSVWTPRIAFLSLGTLLFVFLVHPLLINRNLPQTSIPSFASKSIPQLFQHLKHNWKVHFSSHPASANIPVVYGLASVYSSGTVLCVFIAVFGTVLLLGMTFAPALFLLVTVLFLCLFLLSIRKTDLAENLDNIFNVPWTDVIIWTLLSSYFFFITGHQASISTIQWSAAFVGSSGELTDHIFPAVRVLINTFASHIIYGLGVHLLLIWPFTCQFIFPSVGNKLEFAKQGEYIFTYHEELFLNAAFKLSSKYYCLQGLKLLGTMLAATIHRRHLMVWALFAPRFIFEAIGCAISSVCTFLIFLVLIRIHKYLGRWLTSLEKKHEN